MLVSQHLSPVALRNGTKIAFDYLKFKITYKDFWETANRFSYFLQKEIGHGNRVGIWMSNCPQYAYVFIALSNTKNCSVPLNPNASPEELIFKIKNSELSIILCSTDHQRKLREFLQQNGFGSIKVIEMESKRCAEYDTSYTPPSSHVPNENDEILIFYTPGTTGKYKGCVFNHKAVCQAITSVKGAHKTLPTDVFFTQFNFSSPFHFIHFLLAPLYAAATVYISDATDPKELIPSFTEHRITRVAPNLNLLGDLLMATETENLPIPTVKYFVINGRTISTTLWDLIQKHSKASVLQVYGMTEYLGTIAMNTPDVKATPEHPGMVGPAVVGAKVRVVDDNNDEIDKKKPQKGQLLVMGPAMMTKYLNLPDDQKMNVRGTWLFTGDSVEITEGNIHFLDRKADLVTLEDGRQISPKEIEVFVRDIPQIDDVAYIGVKTAMKKPVSLLILTKKEGALITEKQIQELLAGKVAKEKLPNAIFFIDAMPKTVAGVINRTKLRGLYDGAV
ncbi:MAG: class I adenylate-forming enzyme family protein [Bacteriovoracia bacterium]